MGRITSLHLLAMTAMLLAMACAPAAGPQSAEGAPATAAPQRTLVGISRGEPPTLAAKSLTPFTGSFGVERPAFNAGLTFTDERALVHPHLVEAVPQLNTETWKVFPDGQMETTYRLRPNLTWQDGAPFSSDDFLFAWRLYRTPEFGHSGSAPISQMAEVVAPDPLTVVIRWRQVYVEAGEQNAGFPPLPRHLLEPSLQTLDPVAMAALPFWTTGYVGLGPYRLTRWEPGSFIEGEAFSGHALGRPKIDRIRILFIQEPTTALANLLSGEAHFVGDFVFTATDGETLEKQWAEKKDGVVLWSPTTLRLSYIQLRPEHADPPALLDVRVRRAMAYAMDTDTAIETQHHGKAVRSSTLTHPHFDYYPQIAPSITNFTHDPRRSTQLLEEAGLIRGTDGFYADREGRRMALVYRTFAGERGESENLVFVDSLRRVGIDARQSPFTQAEARDGQALALFPALSFRGTSGVNALQLQISQNVPREQSRWQGNNVGGHSNPEFDQLYQTLTGTLDRSDMVRLTGQLEKIFTDQVPSIVHYYVPGVMAHLSTLQGPTMALVPKGSGGWRGVHTWEWRR